MNWISKRHSDVENPDNIKKELIIRGLILLGVFGLFILTLAIT